MDTIAKIPAALMRDALLGAGTSVWEWDVRSDRLASIDTSSALLGYAPGELRSDQATWNSLIHPEDLAANHEEFSGLSYDRLGLRGLPVAAQHAGVTR